jgi:PKD repeat protein
LGDVGWGSYEEINRIPDTANVHNFGWPCYESANRQATWDAQDLDMCENLYAQGPAAVTAPVYSYSHKLPIVPGENCLDGSSSTSGLAFYQGGSYPDTYDGALFLADYSRGCIWAMFAGADGVPDPSTITPFATPAAFPVDLQIGPGGDLFYVDITGSIRRIEYTSGTTPPNAVVTATPTSGPVPLTVSFDASGSGDPDFGDTISFDWDLDGDGVFGDSTSATPSFTYTQPGTYVARVRVTDNHGAFDDASVTIDAGNSPPVAAIATPVPTTTWKVGDTISFSGSAVDDEDGPLPASALTWTVILHHCGTTCHTHPVQTFTGVASGSFVAPDHAYPSYLELVLTATDSGGLKHTQSRRLDPQIVTLSFVSDPSGMQIAVGDTTGTTPFTREAIVGSTVTIGALSPQTVGGVTYDFRSWSDGGAGGHDIVAGASAATYTAYYAGRPPVANAGTDKTVDSGKSFTLDATGSSQPGGGALGYLWTQIGGPPAVIRNRDQAVTVVEGVTGPATLTFRVTATGPSGLTDTDDVVVTVKKPRVPGDRRLHEVERRARRRHALRVHEPEREQPVGGERTYGAVGEQVADVRVEVVGLVVREHHRAIGAQRLRHRADVTWSVAGVHHLEALEVGRAHHVREVTEHRATAAGRRRVPAVLPATPPDRDAGVRRRAVEHLHGLEIPVLERLVVVVRLRVRVPLVVGARVGLELGEQRDVQRLAGRGTGERLGELLHVAEEAVGERVRPPARRSVLRAERLLGIARPHDQVHREAAAVGVRNHGRLPARHPAQVVRAVVPAAEHPHRPLANEAVVVGVRRLRTHREDDLRVGRARHGVRDGARRRDRTHREHRGDAGRCTLHEGSPLRIGDSRFSIGSSSATSGELAPKRARTDSKAAGAAGS